MLLTVIYIIAITAEAMTGALSAGRRSMDWFGVVLIACVTALGGGSVRDVLLGHYPLTWVKHPEYLVLTCCAAFVTIVIAKWMRHLHNIFLVLDALGLIGFTIIGCQIALQMGHGFVVSAVAGVLTGVSVVFYVTSYVTTSRLFSAVSCMLVFLLLQSFAIGSV